jgi:hypothetical protein
MQTIIQEHGLAGKVYILASVYPNCHQGKWTKDVHKKCRSARYVVKASKCTDCIHNARGACDIFQKKLVETVPWEEARDVFLPKLAADGIKVSSDLGPKRALRRAFSTKPQQKVLDTNFPQHDETALRLDEILRKAQGQDLVEGLEKYRKRGAEKEKVRLVKYLGRLLGAGLLSEDEVRFALRGGSTDTAKARAETIIADRASRARTYSDQGQRDVRSLGVDRSGPSKHISEMEQKIRRVASEHGFRPSEVGGFLRWAQIEMNEGWAGREFDGLLQGRFSEPLIKAASGLLKEFRAEHEGLAGHLYVEASAYGREGIKGCDKGASSHRTNDIPYVLEMPRCASCVFRNVHDNCTKYKKELVARGDFSEEELRQFQRLSIQKVEAPDYERLASLFGAPVDEVDPVSEFGLENDSLERFSYFEEPEPDSGLLFEILTDGMDE